MMKLLQQLTAAAGVSGDEAQVRQIILRHIDGFCEHRTDALGNLICFKKGKFAPKNRVMLSAHMDEVGFIITGVDESGMLKFSAVGGMETQVVSGKPVLVGKNRLSGVVGLKPVHLQDSEEKERVRKMENLYIDIGAQTREEALEYVSLGERAVFDSPFTAFGDGLIKAKALDDRAGCALLIQLLREDAPYDFYAVFTVNEEVGSAAAGAAAFTVRPDIGIVVEATTASDIGGVEKINQVCVLGQGPVLSFMDRGAVYDKALYDTAMALAARENIRVQPKAGVFGGNEARHVQSAADGARVLAVSIPCRYIHSPSNVASLADIDETLRLLRALIAEAAQ